MDFNFELKKEEIMKELSSFTANKRIITEQYVKKRQEVEVAKKRIDLEPELKKLLEEFQKKEQEKLVGVNQNLLTAILRDVIKNDSDERKVVLDIFTERGLPALGIYIEKNEQGVLEDAYNGTGGAVANILSLGLRAIALIQSKKRKFLVLDEGDCWIKPEIIPEFIAVVNELSKKLGIQILVISHHDEHLLNGIENRLVLEKDNGKIKTRWSSLNTPEWYDEDEGIRSIYLENFQSHSSTFIPLSKTVTLLSGVNDLGKSTIVNALRAVFYGQADDTNIKHFEEQAKVVVDFGKNTLFWERKLKGKPKELYCLIDEKHGFENPLHKTESAREVPEWLEEETGIGLIDGFDIQLGHQKRPVFLLDEPASKKAKALSIGDETNYVQKMINLSKEDLTSSRSVVKRSEEDMENWYRELRIYEKYQFDEKEIFELLNKAIKLNQKQEKIKAKYEKYQDLIALKEKLIALENELKGVDNKNNLNDLKDINDLNEENIKASKTIFDLSKVEFPSSEIKHLYTVLSVLNMNSLLEKIDVKSFNYLNSLNNNDLKLKQTSFETSFLRTIKQLLNSTYKNALKQQVFNNLNLMEDSKVDNLIVNIDDFYKIMNGLNKIKTIYKDVLFEKSIQDLDFKTKDFNFNELIKENKLKDLLINLKTLLKTNDLFKNVNFVNNNQDREQSQEQNQKLEDLKIQGLENVVPNINLIHNLIKNIELNKLNIQEIKKLNCQCHEIDLKLKSFNVCPLCHQNIKHNH